MLHGAFREGLAQVAAEASERGGLPGRVKEEVRRYLACGVLRHGFAHVKCESCQESLLVAFSCKSRGWCPSCGTRRSWETGAHCEAVLPEVSYRQWTLSLPRQLRFQVIRKPRLLRAVERRLVRGVWRWQARVARRLGASGPLRGGAVGFAQFFGSALQVTPHLHLLLPEGLWAGTTFVPLPPPSEEDVVAILRRVVKQLAKDFADMDTGWPEDGHQALQAEGIQHRLPLGEANSRRLRGRRLAVLEGFSLHADTHVHAADRQGLEQLCRYGSRGPIAEDRLSLRDDGRYEYRTRRGPTLVLTAAELVKRLVALIPPRGTHLTCWHGVFGPNAKLRSSIMKPPLPSSPPPRGVLSTLPRNESKDGVSRPPRLDWATLQQRTFGVDVWTCRCGGKRKVLAVITSRRTAEGMLRNMGLLEFRPPVPIARGPPQLQLAV